MRITRINTHAIEIFKTFKELNPNLMKSILHLKQVLEFDLLIY